VITKSRAVIMSYLKINQNYFNKFQIIKIKYEILKINAHVVEPNTVFFSHGSSFG